MRGGDDFKERPRMLPYQKKQSWKMRFAGCFLFTPLLHNLVKWRHSRDRWSTWHRFLFYFFFGGGVGLRHQISVFVGCVTGMGCGCVGTVRGIALFENVSVCLSFFLFSFSFFFFFFFNSELKATTMTSMSAFPQPNPRTALSGTILAATEFVGGGIAV